MTVEETTRFQQEIYDELTGNILPFWMNKTMDSELGGFYGQINGRGEVIKNADKGGILNSRILWTFSSAYHRLGNSEYLKTAEYSKDYILKYFFDADYGGTYWKLTSNGKPADTKKQIYSQAFFIYALSEFYKASGDKACRDKAISLFSIIEKHSFDNRLNGYFEAYSRDWKLLEDLRLSDKDANEKKTTNTHLHILEAYTNLYQVWKDQLLESRLRNLVNLFLDKIIDPASHHLLLFFDEKWNSKSSLVSYGHDIEASWLILEGAFALEDKDLITKAKTACTSLAVASMEGLQEDGSLVYERDDAEKVRDMDRHWWPQAEAMAGLMNLYEMTHQEIYLTRAVACWNFIRNNLVDRKNGEWYWSIRADGTVNVADDKAGFWKCPYHNTRACLEVLSRSKRISRLPEK
ncbi:MAG: AGE family epimerase/isomerase [Bacteroidales bacterium]|nr:AGE family epimerase/isomerase [Bacteroidales bacterium]